MAIQNKSSVSSTIEPGVLALSSVDCPVVCIDDIATAIQVDSSGYSKSFTSLESVLKISDWNTAASKSHSHTNQSVLEKLTQTVIDNSHSHTNQKVLDGITSTKVTNWDNVSSKEDTSNKVNSISSSSTEAQYPSAKAVYTAVQGATGTVKSVDTDEHSITINGTTVNYKLVLTDGKLSMSMSVPASPKTKVTLTTAPTAKTLTYTGSAQALVNAGTCSTGGTIQYSVDGGTYSSNIPTATNAKSSYKVDYKVVLSDSTKYELNGTTTGTVNVTIAQANVTITAPTAKTLTYTGSAQVLVNAGTANPASQVTFNYRKLLSDSWSTSIPTAVVAGPHIVYWEATLKDTTNYKTSSATSGSIDVTIKQSSAVIVSGTISNGSFTSSVTGKYVGDSLAAGTTLGTISASTGYNLPTTVTVKHNGTAVAVTISSGTVKLTNALTLAGNITVEATCAIKTFKVTFNITNGVLKQSTTTSTSTTVTVNYNDKATATVAANSGYVLPTTVTNGTISGDTVTSKAITADTTVTINCIESVDYGYYGWISTDTAMKAPEFTSSMFNKHLTNDLPLTITDTTQFTGNYFIIALPNSNIPVVTFESTLGNGTKKVNTGTQLSINNTVTINGKSFYIFILTTPVGTTCTKLNIAKS